MKREQLLIIRDFLFKGFKGQIARAGNPTAAVKSRPGSSRLVQTVGPRSKRIPTRYVTSGSAGRDKTNTRAPSGSLPLQQFQPFVQEQNLQERPHLRNTDCSAAGLFVPGSQRQNKAKPAQRCGVIPLLTSRAAALRYRRTSSVSPSPLQL